MYAKQNGPSDTSMAVSGLMGSGSKSTQKTPQTLSILSPTASDREAHAKYLRDRYGIPVLMAPDDGLDD